MKILLYVLLMTTICFGAVKPTTQPTTKPKPKLVKHYKNYINILQSMPKNIDNTNPEFSAWCKDQNGNTLNIGGTIQYICTKKDHVILRLKAYTYKHIGKTYRPIREIKIENPYNPKSTKSEQLRQRIFWSKILKLKINQKVSIKVEITRFDPVRLHTKYEYKAKTKPKTTTRPRKRPTTKPTTRPSVRLHKANDG